MLKKYKVIIDTDPGIDDANAIVYALNDPQFDIKLFTTSQGNIPIENATRNLCHILDLFEKDIPVVEGYKNRIGTNTEDATFLHTKEGLGGYVSPRQTKTQPQNKDCADSMYEVLQKYPKQIIVFVLGPHTNFAHLLIKHPDAKNLIKRVIMMGGAPMGIKADPNHNSFNIRSDAPAFKFTVDSKIPTVMCPSSIGRDAGYFTEKQVEQIKNTNDVGKFLAQTYSTYWEPNYIDHRIAVNDVATIYFLTHPHMYHIRKADIEVDEKTGKTIAHWNRHGVFSIVVGLNRKKFHKLMFKKLDSMSALHPKFAPQPKTHKIPSTEINKAEKPTKKVTKTAKTTVKASAKPKAAAKTAKKTSKTTNSRNKKQ